MLETLKEYQLNIMLAFSMICGMLAFFVAITKPLSPSRKRILLSLELCSMFLLSFDRFAYFFRGKEDNIAFWMVRISNFMVYLLILAVILIFTFYIIDFYCHEGGAESPPFRLKLACIMCVIGAVLLIISQFTGFYYTFDDQNCYQRSDGFIICYIFPMTVLALDLSVILENFRRFRKLIYISLLMFSIAPIVSSIAQIFLYGLSLTNVTLVGLAILLYIFSLIDMNDMVERANRREVEVIREEQHNIRVMFEQTAAALANAIDAKDKYTHGHSRRVAEYSVKIAKYAGKSEKEINELYFAALLHDVGKIGISDSIINKEGKLTDEEFAVIKTHPVIGMQILSGISQSPYLSIGAHYHHERYDGRGYPEGLKGEDIPDIARIIAVADAYDAMTSKRSYRDPIPQQLVREEFVKGTGTQFDPNYAKIMLHLIDLDSEYTMKEREEIKDSESIKSLVCGAYRAVRSDGILLTNTITRIRLSSYMDDSRDDINIPSFILFDSLDGHIHDDERKQRDLVYFEYASVRADGMVQITGARNVQTTVNETIGAAAEAKAVLYEKVSYAVEAVRCKDHVRIKLANQFRSHEIIIALPDSTRFCYLAITGEQCTIAPIDITKTNVKVSADEIPRIAEEISYIKNEPVGDIPNVQVDGWRSDSTEGIEVTDDMTIRFHAISLPTARLVWHCPFALLYSSDDGETDGKNYRELTVIRLDGEGWEEDDDADNKVYVNKLEDFTDWNSFKERNKEGQECELHYHLGENSITIETEYCGLYIRSVTTVTDSIGKVFTALTGDQCAITDIHILR